MGRRPAWTLQEGDRVMLNGVERTLTLVHAIPSGECWLGWGELVSVSLNCLCAVEKLD